MAQRRGAIVAGIAAGLIASPVFAQGLQPVDMAGAPLSQINLVGGSFVASLLETETPFKSQLLISCQDCAPPVDAQVGVAADTQNEAQDFLNNPNGFLGELETVCLSQAEVCAFSQSTVGGLPGYALNARYADGIFIVEHVYFSNGLSFVINASGPDLDAAKTNVAALIRATGPYVTGQKP